MCLLDIAGAGISHALGVGGRDLSAEVSGRSTLQALAALDADPATELIVIVSKPPAPRVADLIHAAARRLAKPVLFALLGEGPDDLTSVVEKALTALGLPLPEWPVWGMISNDSDTSRASSGPLRGLFAGGTLCDEAMLIASDTLGEIRSNTPLRPEWEIDPSDHAPGAHLMIDFGDDRLTQGRAHPMIDPTLRLERLAAETANDTGVILLDVVLGHTAEPDPSAALAPVIAASRIPVVVSLCGTAEDPQNRDHQANVLAEAGAAVFASNAMATRHAVQRLRGVEDFGTHGTGHPRRQGSRGASC
jgi:FdrA protein